jgi:tyrosine-protein kinase Etk/Wzc
VLAEDRSLDEALVQVDVGWGRLRVLPGGSPPNRQCWSAPSACNLLAELSEMSDIVIIDTPALLAISDALPLLDQVSGTVLVARPDRTTRDALGRISQVISSAKGSILGVVAIGAKAGGLYGYSTYGYGSGSGAEEGDKAEAARGDGAQKGCLGRPASGCSVAGGIAASP